MKKFCKLSALKHQVAQELNWLDQVDSLSDAEQCLIANYLWHRAPNEVVCREGVKVIDVEALTSLVGERYLDNMTMDVCILKYAALAQARGLTGTLYLPFEIWTWLRQSDREQIECKLAALIPGMEFVDHVIAIVHFRNHLHWGLLVIDVEGQKLLFDDGFNCRPDLFVIEGAKKILETLSKMFPLQPTLQSLFWTNITRDDALGLGMDNQTVAAAVHGQGSGSCGVGVILAAKGFIQLKSKAINNMSWKYKDMRLYRKQLMLQIISWK